MSNLGRYQDIVVEANKAGGPDVWLDAIKKAAYSRGASDMKNTLVAPLLLTGVGIGTVGVIGYQKIKKWISEFGFSAEVILNACERAVLATDHNRFPYANAILTKWHDAKVKNLKDIEALDASHQKAPASSKKEGGFNDFEQRSYDYGALEKMLLSN